MTVAIAAAFAAAAAVAALTTTAQYIAVAAGDVMPSKTLLLCRRPCRWQGACISLHPNGRELITFV